MKLLEGKKGLVFGVANNRSLAWGIARAAANNGAELAFTYLNDAVGKRAIPLAQSLGSKITLPCNVQNEEGLEAAFAEVSRCWGKIDFVVHSIAFAPEEDMKGRFSETSRSGFLTALDVSVYSFIAVARHAKRVLNPGGSLLTLSYFGARQVFPNYRLMGVAKAALEATVRELAADLGPESIRVNAISAGPIKTLAASGIADFKELLSAFAKRAPLRRLVAIDEVGDSAVYLLSDLARSTTGEVHFVDAGFSITAL